MRLNRIIVNSIIKTPLLIIMFILIGGIARTSCSKNNVRTSVTGGSNSRHRLLSSFVASSSSSSPRCGAGFMQPCGATSSRSTKTFNSPTTTLLKKPQSKNRSFSSFSRAARRPLSMLASSTTPADTAAASLAHDSCSSMISGEEMLAAFNRPVQGQNVAAAMRALAMADCVCFDVDSTVVDEEGIDVLAEHLGMGEQVAALTLQAMEGGLPFQDALRMRLDLLQPSRAAIQACLRDHPLRLSPGAENFITKLHAVHKHVYLVSGGFRIMIEPVAQLVHVNPVTNIVANTILFDNNGNYAGFDANEPTSRDMGKPTALRRIQEQHQYTCMIMIGDGATDAQAKPPATAFIGYGGIAVREKVQKVADWFVTDFDDLSYIVDQYCSSNNNSSTK